MVIVIEIIDSLPVVDFLQTADVGNLSAVNPIESPFKFFK